MGLFSKFKNMVTGGGASVTLEAAPARIGGSLQVTVKVSVSDDDVTTEGVYLKLSCEERSPTFHFKIADTNNDGKGDKVEIDKDDNVAVVYSVEEKLSDQRELKSGQTYIFKKEITIPAHCKRSSEDNRVKWSVQAGVEMKGNDPDTGWQIITVS